METSQEVRPDVSDDTSTFTTRLLVGATAVAVVADLAWMVLLGALIPPMLVFAVVAAILFGVLRGRPRPLAIAFGLLGLFFLGAGGQFVRAELGHPNDMGGFAWAVLTGTGRVVTIVAAGLVLARATRWSRPLAVAGGALVVGLLGWSGAVVASTSSDQRQPGDIEVAAVQSAFPSRVAVDSGGVVYAVNEDRWRHTFTVEGTDIHVDLPPTIARRVPIDLAPGTYDLVCTVHGHETMTADLVVE